MKWLGNLRNHGKRRLSVYTTSTIKPTNIEMK